MTRTIATVAAAAAVLLAVLVLMPLAPLLPLPEAPVAASPGAVAPTGTVASLRALARRRGLRSAGGRPIHTARRADLLAALAA